MSITISQKKLKCQLKQTVDNVHPPSSFFNSSKVSPLGSPPTIHPDFNTWQSNEKKKVRHKSQNATQEDHVIDKFFFF